MPSRVVRRCESLSSDLARIGIDSAEMLFAELDLTEIETGLASFDTDRH